MVIAFFLLTDLLVLTCGSPEYAARSLFTFYREVRFSWEMHRAGCELCFARENRTVLALALTLLRSCARFQFRRNLADSLCQWCNGVKIRWNQLLSKQFRLLGYSLCLHTKAIDLRIDLADYLLSDKSQKRPPLYGSDGRISCCFIQRFVENQRF